LDFFSGTGEERRVFMLIDQRTAVPIESNAALFGEVGAGPFERTEEQSDQYLVKFLNSFSRVTG
jgi:hypothetical protein